MCKQKRYPVKSGMVFAPAQLRASSRYNVNWQPNTANEDGDGYENVTYEWICAASNLIALIPSRLFRQMLANCFGVEF